jgi:hypothetical protein
MRVRYALSVCLLLSFCTVPLLADETRAPLIAFTPAEVVRGGVITITVGDIPATAHATAILSLHQTSKTIPPDIPLIPTPGTSATQPFAITSNVPDIPIGNYDVKVNVEGYPQAIAATTLAVSAPQPKVDSIDPPVPYPNEKLFVLTVNGDHFSPIAEENVLVVDGNPATPCDNAMKPDDCVPTPTVLGARRQLLFRRIPYKYRGRHKLAVSIGGSRSENQVDAILSRVDSGAPRVYAIVTVIALLVFVVALALPAWKHAPTGGTRRSLFGMFFYDQATSSYSLSNAQFYLWTFVVVAGYVYLTASRSLVQGTFEWADVPGNLPGILLISATTAVVATGVGNDKTKGAGATLPSVSDFVTSGGLVVPERVQFVVWTVLGALSFLFFVFAIEPALIQKLPSIPEGFLYLMGISSAGYLGGKMTRAAGPVITTATGVIGGGNLTVKVDGRNLSPTGKLAIEGVVMTVPATPGTLEDDRRFAKDLTFVVPLANADPKVPQAAKAGVLIGVINDDAQRAEKKIDVT